MKTGIKYTVRTMFYSAAFLALVALPQIIAQHLGAPPTF